MQAVSGNFAQKWLFCETYVLFSICSFICDQKCLQECLNIEFSIGKKTCRLILQYRSPSQKQEEFDTFLDNLESNQETASFSNPFLTILIVDFNAKCTGWYSTDNSTTEGSKLRL